MNNSKPTDLVLIVDNSSSIIAYADQYVKSINTIITLQRELNPQTRLFFSLFNICARQLFVAKPITEVPELTIKDIRPQAMTAFYDIVSSLLVNLTTFFEKTNRSPTTVVILTDGDDTCSQRIKPEQLAVQIALYKQQGWQFVFLGCTEKSIQIGKSLGFNVNIFYSTTEKSFNTIPVLLRELKLRGIKDSDWDIRELEQSMEKMEM